MISWRGEERTFPAGRGREIGRGARRTGHAERKRVERETEETRERERERGWKGELS